MTEALRTTYLAGRELTKNEAGECTVGKEGFGVIVNVAPATEESVRALQTSQDPVPGLGRVAASGVRSRIKFLASAVDCEITVEVTNRLDAGTRFARALDQVFTADSVKPR